jgi:hypothetical protein
LCRSGFDGKCFAIFINVDGSTKRKRITHHWVHVGLSKTRP